MDKINQVGENFNLSKFLLVREKTISTVKKVSELVEVGMSEADGIALIDQVLKKTGHEKNWHPHKFRIAKNTILSFSEKSDDSIRLKENDIFSVDIGPVWDNFEGDYGETFVMGSDLNFKAIKECSEDIFTDCKKYWQENKCSGIELYDYAEKKAHEKGYILKTDMNGHRLGDFPHHVFYRGGLNEIDKVPADNIWVLEIHLLNLDCTYGAFFEDILTKPKSS